MAKEYKLTAEDMFVLPIGSDKTFSHDSKLPNLPVPSLRHTLERYVESIQPFVSAEELAHSKQVVQEFEHGIGKRLHQKLLQRASNTKNWLEKWWEDLAYLSGRQPLIPHSNMSGFGLEESVNQLPFAGDQLKVTALYMYHLMKVWQLLRTERLRPMQGGNNMPFSMSQFRNLYNTVRLPGQEMDSLVSYFKTESEGPCPDHVIVLCKGRIFRMSTLNECGGLLCPDDWEDQLRAIENACRNHEGPGIGVLTCDDRTRWAKNRKHLENINLQNREMLQTIDRAVCILVLDQDQAPTVRDVGFKSLSENYSNRWADKSLSVHVFKNGSVGGLCEHCAFDGMTSMTAMYHNFLAMKEPLPPQQRAKNLSPPTEMCFDIDQTLKGEIQLSKRRHEEETKSMMILMCDTFTGYGKQMIQVHKLHPDSFVQMALQLAYYRLHHKPAPTYETATTRTFYNGRTETVRSCTVEAMKWIHAMLNPQSSTAERKGLLRSAVLKHDALMKASKDNAGCDRHLFGLYCIAAEEGIPIPSLFTDPAYARSGGGGYFVLSTSLVGYTPMLGGVAPMCPDGYGVFYNICPHSITFAISVWREGPESSARKLFKSLEQSLTEIMQLLGPAPAKL